MHALTPALMLRHLTPWELDLLAPASRALYVDEGVAPPALPALRIALHRRLIAGARGMLFLTPDLSGELVAFALISGRRQARIEQFRVEPMRRRGGWGRRCIQMLLTETLANAESVHVRVLADNPVGIAFWRALGFGEGCRYLEVMPRPGEGLARDS